MMHRYPYPDDAICLHNHANSIITFKTAIYKDKIVRTESRYRFEKFNFCDFTFTLHSNIEKKKAHISTYQRSQKILL